MKRVLVGALSLAALGCGGRKPIPVGHDAGPSVVVVDPAKRRPPTAQAVVLVDEQEPDDDFAHAQPLEAGKGIRGTIALPSGKKGDEDYYQWLEAAAPGAAPAPLDGGAGPFDLARVELTCPPNLKLRLDVYDGDHKKLATVDGTPGEKAVVPNLAVEPGRTYYARVTAEKGGDPKAPYELVVRSTPGSIADEREPDDDLAHATVLAALGDATGFFGRRRDEDWLRVPIADSGILRLELQPVEGVAVELRVLDADGTHQLADARGGRGEELRLRNVGVQAGSAVVVLKATEGRNVDVPWTLRLGIEAALDGAEREPNDNAATTTPLPLAGASAQVSGFLWPGDVDVYRVTGTDGMVTAELDGVERVDLKLERLTPDGKPLVKADDNGVGKGEALPPWPVVDGAALFRVSGRAHDTAFDAPYRLTVTGVPVEPDLEREPDDSPEKATAWPEGAEAMRGYLAPRGDVDVFRFVAPAGKTRASVTVSGPIALRAALSDEQRLPLAPDGPITSGRSYFVTVKAVSDKAANPREPYRVTLRLE
jgi:hypothetical protein